MFAVAVALTVIAAIRLRARTMTVAQYILLLPHVGFYAWLPAPAPIAKKLGV